MEKFPTQIKDKRDANPWEKTITVDPQRVMVYDIETTGVTKFDHITTVAWSIGGELKHCVFGDDWTEFEEDWRRASGIVTFNGTYFDEKFIAKDFALTKHPRHCDLRFFLKAKGRKGGLKKLAEAENMNRPAELHGVDGFFAVSIWKYYQATGDKEALIQLLAYNTWDVILTAELFKKFVMPELPTDFETPLSVDLEKLKQIKDYWEKPRFLDVKPKVVNPRNSSSIKYRSTTEGPVNQDPVAADKTESKGLTDPSMSKDPGGPDAS